MATRYCARRLICLTTSQTLPQPLVVCLSRRRNCQNGQQKIKGMSCTLPDMLLLGVQSLTTGSEACTCESDYTSDLDTTQLIFLYIWLQ